MSMNKYPELKSNATPAEWFALGHTNWLMDRAKELRADTPPDYRYYITSAEEHIGLMWRDHTIARNATLAEFENGEEEQFSFRVTETGVGTVLGGIARQLGWRIVPAAKMADVLNGYPYLGDKVEAEAREWVMMADTVFKMIRTFPRTKADIQAAQVMMFRLREMADGIVSRLKESFPKAKA